MPKINQKLVDKLNEEVSSDNFEQIIDKYELDTPEQYSHEMLCEQDGIEVWGESEDGEVLVYDNVNGFYLLPKAKWIQEIRNVYEEEAEQILIELGVIKPIIHEFKIFGYEAIERTATPVSSKSNTNRVYVPKDWTRVMVVRLE